MKTYHRLLIFPLMVLAVAAYGADAAANWAEHCAKCHGATGKGDTKMGRKLGIGDLTDAKVQAKFTDTDAFKAMKEGVKDADGKVSMKPAEGLSDDDLKALIPVVRAMKK